MTSISGFGASGVSNVLAAGTTSRPKSAIDVAAKLFGISADDLTAQLAAGKSMTDVAKSSGVSKDDLVSALVAGMPSNLASTGDPTQIATTIADQVGLPQGPGGAGGPAGPPPPPPSSSSSSTTSSSSGSSKDVLDELSSLLGTDRTTLSDQLTSGTNLSDLLTSAGVSMSSLAGALQNGLLLDTSA